MQDAEEADNSSGEEFPVFATTSSGRVSRLPERLQYVLCGKISEPFVGSQAKASGEGSLKVVSKAVCENAASQNYSQLASLFETLGGQKQRETNLFVYMQGAEQVLEIIRQAPEIDLESMLMDILESETAIGLSEKELLSEDTCKTVS